MSPAAATHASPRTTRLPLFGVRVWLRPPTFPRPNTHSTEPHTACARRPRRGAATGPPTARGSGVPSGECATCHSARSCWGAAPAAQHPPAGGPQSRGCRRKGCPCLFHSPYLYFLRGEGWKCTRSWCPLRDRPGTAGTPASAGQGAARQGREEVSSQSRSPLSSAPRRLTVCPRGREPAFKVSGPRSAGQIPSGVGQRKRQPKGPRAGRHLGGAGPPREAGAPRGPGPPSSPRLAREFRSGARGGSDLPPFTPMDGSSFAPAIASTIPTMNHSFLSLSSSLMFVRMGGFCLLVCLFSFWSCVR